MVEAESIDESVEDMTAALMAPRPKKATQGGVKYCRQRGKTKLVSLFSTLGLLPYSVSSHLKKNRILVKLLHIHLGAKVFTPLL